MTPRAQMPFTPTLGERENYRKSVGKSTVFRKSDRLSLLLPLHSGEGRGKEDSGNQAKSARPMQPASSFALSTFAFAATWIS
jgi:hypothetical protein